MLHKIRLSSKTYTQIKGQEEMCPYVKTRLQIELNIGALIVR